METAFLTRELLDRADQLAHCTEEPGRITRRFLTEPVRQVHSLLTEWMLDAGLQPRIDALGNVVGRKPGTNHGEPAFLIGSHFDTVPNAGRYDGLLGILLGIAALKALRDHQFSFPIDVCAFSEEEGVRYSTPYLGSAAVVARFDPAWLGKQDADGISLRSALTSFGFDPQKIVECAYAPESVRGYLEAHIEQGPVLESRDLSLGIVEAIVGQSRRWLTFTGQAGHAGTQPMELRRDALVGAAVFIQQVEQHARATPGLRATVGFVGVQPNAVNVVPGSVHLSLDVRHSLDPVRERALGSLLASAASICQKRGLALESEPLVDQPAVPCDAFMQERLARVLKSIDQTDFRLPSGAGHDAVMMSHHCPVAMLFVRSPGGISHHPDEAVRPGDVELALRTVILFLEQLEVS